MATEAEIGGTVRYAHLLDLYNMRFTKLVPIGRNGTPTIGWTPIYDNANYWTQETLVKQASKFIDGVATCFGDTGLSDDQGPLYLNSLDIDCDAVYHELFTLRNPKIDWSKYSHVKKIFEQGCVVKTKKPKGYHVYWFSHKQHNPIHTIDCKSDHQFEIHTDKSSGTGTLPPSRHRKDHDFEYKWEVRSGIPTSDNFYDVVLEVLSDCLKQKPLNDYQNSCNGTKEESKQDSGHREQKQDSGNGNGKSTGLELEESDIQRIMELLQPYYVKGHRNAIVLGLSGPLRKEGISKNSVMALVETLANNDGISDQADIRKAMSVVEETYKKDPSSISGKNHFKLNVLLPVTCDYQITNDILGKIFKIILDVQGRGLDKIEKEDLALWLRRNIMAEHTIHTMSDNRELYLYDERRGVYLTNKETRIEAFCQSIGHDVKTNVISEAINQVKRTTYIDRSEFDSGIDIVNVENGLLNIHTLEFTKHSPKHPSITQLPIRYDPKARCPNIVKFFAQVFKPEDIPAALQLFGYCLLRTNRYEKTFLLAGKGANGKSTFIRVLQAFLGLDNVSQESLQNLAETRWSKAQLFGKFANIYADLGRQTVKRYGYNQNADIRRSNKCRVQGSTTICIHTICQINL